MSCGPTLNDAAWDEQPADSSALGAALTYAARGWRVIPIPPGQKHPAIQAWQKAGTTDPDRIRHWWTQAPGHGVGIVTGRDSGVFVLDVDVSGDKQGDDTLAELEARYGQLPATVEVLTGSGGRHLYFAIPAGVEIRNDAGRRLGPGLDIRGEGGQVLAPPTVHPNGRPYRFELMSGSSDPVAEPPRWLVDLLTAEPGRPAPAPPGRPAPGRSDRPGDLWAAETSWADLLEPDGWTLHHVDPSGEHHWTRPGKERRDGTSATTGYNGSDSLKVFTSSLQHWGLHPEETYSKLGYLAATRHAGDHQAAARALREAGWRSPEADLAALIDRTAPAVSAGSPSLPAPPERPTTWQPVDLAPVLAGIATGTINRPTPTVGRRSDGAHLFYEGRINSIFGDSGAGKSMTALAVSAGELHAGRHVIWVDYEDDEVGTSSRLLDFGLDPGLIVAQFHYLRPEELFDGIAEERFAGITSSHDVSLVVIDSTGEAMGLEGKKVNDDLDNALWTRRYPRYIANLGPAVLLIDHVVKNKEARGLDPAGSYRKRASITGAAYLADPAVEFGIGRTGRSHLTCAKDRAGNWVRGHRVADFTLDATIRPYRYALETPETSVDASGQFRPTVLMEKVSRWLEVNPGASKNQIETARLGKAEYVRQAVDVLVREGFVQAEKHGQAVRHSVERAYREDME